MPKDIKNMRNRDFIISLQELLKNEEFTMYELSRAAKAESGKEIIDHLFFFLTEKLETYKEGKNLDVLVKAIETISIVLDEYTNINLKSVRKRLRKQYETADRIQKEQVPQFMDPESARQEIEKIKKTIEKSEKETKKRESTQYLFVKFIINDSKNLDYLEETFKVFPYMVNVKDKHSRSIFCNVVNHLLKNIIRDEEEKVRYYRNVISLMMSQKDFKLRTQDRSDCLNKIKHAIQKLSYQTKDYTIKKKMILELKDILFDRVETHTMLEQLVQDYRIHTKFPSSMINELESFISNANENGRKIVKECTITIDGKDPVEIDDALSIRKLSNGNYLLGTHIASVLSYLPYHSAVVQEAMQRESSIYLPNVGTLVGEDEYTNVIPILPYRFSAKRASLLENATRYATSFFLEIDGEGQIVDVQFEKTIIQITKNCSYEEVNKVVHQGSTDKNLEATVHLLDELTYKLEANDQGKDIYADIKEQEINPANLKVSQNSRAEKIVNQTMKLTNSCIAEFFAQKGYPFLYRVHAINNENIQELEEQIKNISNVHDKEQFDRLYNVLLGIYPKAYYDLSGSHEGLGLKHYCHGTSPLRRSADILVEHALDVCYFNTPSDQDLTKLEKDVITGRNIVNAKSRDIDYFVTNYEKIKCKKNIKIR